MATAGASTTGYIGEVRRSVILMSDIIQFLNDDEPADDEYESANGSVWIVAVDVDGLVSILQAPNVNPFFFDAGCGAEEIGLPFELCDTLPGVYRWVCDYVTSRDWETGIVDSGEFEVREETILWAVPA